jgi:hypothetical protein
MNAEYSNLEANFATGRVGKLITQLVWMASRSARTFAASTFESRFHDGLGTRRAFLSRDLSGSYCMKQ